MTNQVLRTIVLPDGRTIVLREMDLPDVDAIAALYEGLSADDRYHRFFSVSRPKRPGIERWVRRCREAGLGIVAAVDGGPDGVDGEVIAEAGYVRVPNGDAEFAITVASRWRGWLGPVLLDLLVGAAASEGIPNLEAEILLENRLMLAMTHLRGDASLGASDFSSVRVMFSTSGDTPTWPPRTSAPRVLVEAAGHRWGRSSALDASGYEVVTCGGPAHREPASCPALSGKVCPLVQGADAVVVALRPDDPRTELIIAAHHRLHPEIQVIVQPPTDVPDAPSSTPGVCRLSAGAPAAELLAALRDAVRSHHDGS